MSSKFDEEIREVEARVAREREALHLQAENLRSAARQAAGSPKGLAAAVVVGFLFGELTAPRRRRAGKREGREQTLAAPAKTVGVLGVLGSAALTFVRHRYGSPWVLANRAWHYYQAYQAHKQAQAAAARRPAPVVVRPPGSAPAPGAAPARTPPAASPGSAAVRSEPPRASEHDTIRKTHAAS